MVEEEDERVETGGSLGTPLVDVAPVERRGDDAGCACPIAVVEERWC